MVGNSATTLACEFQRTEWRRHDSEHETTGMGKKHRGLSRSSEWSLGTRGVRQRSFSQVMFRVPPVRQSASAGPSKTPPYWTDAPRINSGPLREEEYLGFLAFAALTSGGYTRRSAVAIQTRWPTSSEGL
jgi:hypothetical protein